MFMFFAERFVDESLRKAMPQLRKRKTKEKVLEEFEKNTRVESPVVPKKKKTETPQLTKTRVSRSRMKRKTSDSPVCSDEEFLNTCSKNKKIVVKNSLSARKHSKLGKEAVYCTDVKDEPSDSENFQNSTDSGISLETFTNASKEETTLDIADQSQPSTSFANDSKHKDESSSSESEWEEVENQGETASLDDYKPDIPKEGVEITIDCPDLRIRKRTKKQFDENEWIRLHINRVRKDIQLSIHKTHLLCLLAHGIYVNKILNCDAVKALALSLIPADMFSYATGKKKDKIDVGIEKVVSWFRDTFSYENEKCLFLNPFSSLSTSFTSQKAMNASEYNLMFIVIARILGFKVRLCISLYPITYKASNLIKKPNSKKNSKKTASVERTEKKAKCETSGKQTKVKQKREMKVRKTPKEKAENSGEMTKKKSHESFITLRNSAGKSYKFSSDEDDNDNSSGEDFKETRKMVSKVKRESQSKQLNRKILSSESGCSSPEPSALVSGNVICWAEIFSKLEKQWVSIECANNIINEPFDIEKLVPKPVSYILAFDNDSYVKDVTRRYCSEYMTLTIKLRVDLDWWEETLDPFLPPNSMQNKAEEKKLDEMLVNKPLPTTVQGFKNHPLYALKRHLLKFEAIYPPDAPPVGFMRSEPVYARDCVHLCHSRETWLKEARVVRMGEQPYKIVKARPKWDRIAGVMRTDLPLEIFGHWQTEQYEPPVAVDGKVPRNEYGNVELFKACMLPKGTVHLQLPGLNRVAKKLGIDCSPAVVGFDGHKGSVHPVFEGFVVCKEFKDVLIAAWDEDQENARKREEEKREKRIYGNWKKLIRGLLIRERIKLKYDTK